jgi:Flp pilus assembly pilin Flp
MAMFRQKLGRIGQKLGGTPRQRDDDGMTLVEMLLASSLLVVITTLVMISITVFTTLGTSVDAQYQEYDTALPAVTNIGPLIAAEAEPGPADVTRAPTPGFGLETSGTPDTISGIGNFSLTFYANVANANGPAKIVAGLTTSTGTPNTGSTTTCAVKTPCNFQVHEYLPTAGTCPGVNPLGVTCTYPTTFKIITNVLNVINATAQPVFSYVIFDPATTCATQTTPACNTFVLTAANVISMSFPVPSATYGVSTANLAQCKPASGSATLAISCPADAIQRVGIDLQVKAPGDSSGHTSENSSLAYRAQGNSTSPNLPYQYSSSVG